VTVAENRCVGRIVARGRWLAVKHLDSPARLGRLLRDPEQSVFVTNGL